MNFVWLNIFTTKCGSLVTYFIKMHEAYRIASKLQKNVLDRTCAEEGV